MPNVNKVNLLIRCSLLIIVLLGFGNQAYAEQIDKSVYDNILQNQSEKNKAEDDTKKDMKTEQNSKNDNQTKEQSDLLLEETNSDESRSLGVTIWDFVKMIFATIFVVFLIYFILRFINKRNHGYKNSQIIENIGGTALGANRSIQLIKVGKRLLIVGVGDSIQLIKEIEDEQEYKEILEEYNRKLDQLVQPSDIVTKVKNVISSSHSAPKTKESFSIRLSKELERISSERKEKMDVLEKKKKGSSEKMNEFIQFFNNNDPGNVSTSVQLLLLLTVLSLAPSIIILLTSFTRIVIVLSFVRTALATQQMPLTKSL